MAKLTAAQRGEMMRSAPVRRVIPRLAVPTMVSMLITSVYNMADTYFVGQIGADTAAVEGGVAVATSAAGAVGVIFPAMSIIQAIAFTIGIGCSANMSQALGARRQEEAERYASVGFFTALLAGLAITALGNLFLDPLVRLLGATDTIAPFAQSYASYIFYAAPFMVSSLVMNNLLRFQGLAAYGMVGMGIGGLLNMVLDPLLIFTLDMGIAGAAVATGISQLVSFLLLLLMTNLREDAISIRFRNFRPTRRMYGKILYTGFPSLGRQGIASVASVVLNQTAGAWGDPAIAAMSIVSRFVMFINASVIGFGQGFQPVCAYNFGAGQFERVKEAYRFCVKVTTVILLVLAAASLCFSGQIVARFRDDPAVVEIGTLALRLQLLTVPLWGFFTMSNMMTQSIGFGAMAMLLSASRQGIFLLPLLLILPRPGVLDLLGLQLAQPLADVMAVVLAVFVVRRVLKRIDGMAAGRTAAENN